MDSRINKRKHSAKPGNVRVPRARRIAFDVTVAIFVSAIFCLKIVNYVDPGSLHPPVMTQTLSVIAHDAVSALNNLTVLNHCPHGLSMQDISGGYVCVQGPGHGIYSKIYRSYPLVGKGRESIYSSTDEGTVAAANDVLHNKFDLPRYKPVQFRSLPTWSENSHNVSYWRFEFYSLRPSLNLLYAYRTTGKLAYARRLIRLDTSFIAAESRSRWAWADPHAVAFRSMTLVDTWWKLRQNHQLPESASTAILKELEKTGQFLADPNHYQPGENHSMNEAAALYSLAVAFPALPHADGWLAQAKERLRWQLAGIIDADGQLIENSPYYDFYTLEKYWQIYNYSIAQGYPISANFESKLQSMLNFATYILQPNSQVPLLGASLETTINDHGAYASMAASDPALQYVLTHGAEGTMPPERSVYFRASALTIMRSGWGTPADFAGSTYLTYNVGRYRTAHSDLDALGFTLYGDGGDLLPGPGLYTYTVGPYHHYFHGTMSHDAVVVDGKSQAQGNGTGGPLVTKDGMTYQSAESSLYEGVTHRRLVMMIDADHVLVVDRLSSAKVHTYQQMFHLFPGARLSKSGLTVSGTGGTPRREITIQQLKPGGLTESDTINRRGKRPDGLCSNKYGQLLPCYAISYSARGKDATFVTLLTIGRPRQAGFAIKVRASGQHLRIHDGQRDVGISLGESAASAPTARATDPAPPPAISTAVRAASAAKNWTSAGAGSLSFGPRSDGPRSDGPGTAVADLSSDRGSPAVMENNAVRLDLGRHNARLRLKVTGLARVGGLQLRLSNNHWAKSVTMNLLNTYTDDDAGQWVTLFLGPGGRWNSQGGWRASAPGFNWAKVDGLQIDMITRKRAGPPSTVSFGGLTLVPAQEKGNVVFVFDDGEQSILPAADYLHKNRMPGNVAVVGKYVDYQAEDYLNVFQLKALQDNWGWDMVNHTQRHVYAVRQYYDRHELSRYVADIVQQASWLEANGLNSAPNWFVYPYGSTNAELERVVGRFYKFAQVVADGPDAYPYGDPREITDLQVRCRGDGESGEHGYTSPAEILSAVHQAVINHMTLILTFHRIRAEPSDLRGYRLSQFKKVVDGVRKSGVRVMTFSQLDRSNGVPVSNRIYSNPGQPSQITVQVSG